MVLEENLVDQESTLWLESIIASFVTSSNIILINFLQLIGEIPVFLQALLESSFVRFVLFCEEFQNSAFSAFSEFQVKLLLVFLAIISIHIVAICIAWKIYSDRITARFLKSSPLISHEQLKTAVSELKLPAEHTPRW